MGGSVDGLFDLPIAEQLDNMIREGVPPREVVRYVQEEVGIYTDVAVSSLVAVVRGRKSRMDPTHAGEDVLSYDDRDPGVRVRKPRAIYNHVREVGMRTSKGEAELAAMMSVMASMQDYVEVGIDAVNKTGRFDKQVFDSLNDLAMVHARVYEMTRKYHLDERKAETDAALARANEEIARATAALPATLSKVMANPESRQKLLAFASRMRAVHRVIEVGGEPVNAEPQAPADPESAEGGEPDAGT